MASSGPSRERDKARIMMTKDSAMEANLQTLSVKAESRLAEKRRMRAEARRLGRQKHEEMEKKSNKAADADYTSTANLEKKVDNLKLKLVDGSETTHDSGVANVMNDATILALRKEVEDAIAMKNEVELSKTQLYHTIEDLRDRLEGAEADMYTAVENMKAQKRDMQQAQIARDDIVSERAELMAERIRLENRIRDLESDAERKLARMDEGATKQSEAIARKENKLSEAQDTIEELRNKVNELNIEKRAVIDQLDTANRRAEVEIAESKSKSRKTTDTGDLDKLKEDIEDLKMDRARLDRQWKKAVQSVKTKEKENTALEDEVTEVKKEARKVNRELRQLRQKNAELLMEVDRLKRS